MSYRIGIRAWIDFAFKKIFGKPGNEICLISLLNSILRLREPIQKVEFLNPFTLQEFEIEKQIFVDVKATDTLGRIFVVEMQIVVAPGFSSRAVFYACKAYTEQLVAGQGYNKLKATYSVSILMRSLWDDDRLHHHFRLVDAESGEPLEDAIEIHTVELSKYNAEVLKPNASVLEQWCYWIKRSHEYTEAELQVLLPGLEFLRATHELNEISQITMEKHMYDSREKAILDYEAGLIDARELGRVVGLEEGREEGRVVGREEGREEGREVGLLQGEVRLIQTLQEILGEPITDTATLMTKPRDSLQRITAELRNRIKSRT